MNSELIRLSAWKAASLISAGDLTSEALVTACLERIGDREPAVQAWQFLDPEAALKQAKQCDSTKPKGPLHGVPVGIKDNIDTQDMPTTYGSAIYENHYPRTDADCVKLLRAAGAIILGKTVTTEFATFKPGKTRNPHNSRYTPGGSSSGSAAAVADLMVPIALGTQTAGSVIRPAAFCGVFGMKYTYDSLSLEGVKWNSRTLDTLGGFARNTRDLMLLYRVLKGELEANSNRPLNPSLDKKDIFLGSSNTLRIGFCKTPQWEHADTATKLLLETTVEKLSASGLRITSIDLPAEFVGLAEAQKTIMSVEAARELSRELHSHRELLSPQLCDLLERGKGVPESLYQSALELGQCCRELLDRLFVNFDILLTASAPGEAPERLDTIGDPVFNRIWTLLHVPCINIPAFKGPHGLPIGIQAIGKSKHDERMLEFCSWLTSYLCPTDLQVLT